MIVGILMIAAAAISAIAVTKWNFSAPKDYEECVDGAAREAKSIDALSMLVSNCGSSFAGRRKEGGGYTYYDQCQGSTFDINGPNPTPDEARYIRDQCMGYLSAKSQMEAEEIELVRKKQQAAAAASSAFEARILAVIPAVRVTAGDFKDCEANNGSFCKLGVEVTNGSQEPLSKIVISISNLTAVGNACPSSHASQFLINVRLSPGEKRETTIDVRDVELSKHPLCIKVLNVEFAGG